MFFITFSLSPTTQKKITLGSSYAIAQECFFEIPWMKPVWRKEKQKQSLAPTMVTFPKFPWNFTACVTDQICARDTEEDAKEEYVSKISSRS